MTKLSNGTIVTDIHNATDNQALASKGYPIRHIETFHDHDTTWITWDAPDITEAELPF